MKTNTCSAHLLIAVRYQMIEHNKESLKVSLYQGPSVICDACTKLRPIRTTYDGGEYSRREPVKYTVEKFDLT